VVCSVVVREGCGRWGGWGGVVLWGRGVVRRDEKWASGAFEVRGGRLAGGVVGCECVVERVRVGGGGDLLAAELLEPCAGR